MSREAMEAVQDHSSITDAFGLNIFIAIARFVAADSKTGWVSDRVAAEKAHCDKDSIKPWREKLEAAGEIRTWTTGSGRGTKRWYEILLPFDEPTSEPVIRDNNEERPALERDINNGTLIERMSQQLELLSRQIELLSQRLELSSRENVPNVPPRTGQEHHSTILSTNEHQGEHPRAREKPAPLPSPDPPESKHPPGPADLKAMAIAEVCGLDYNIPELRRQCETAAVQLRDYSPEIIRERYGYPNGHEPAGWNWYSDDWRGRGKDNRPGEMPTPLQVVSTIKKQRVPAGQKQPIPDQGLVPIEEGVY